MMYQIRILFFYIFILGSLFLNNLNATHIVGGDISVRWLNNNDFEVTLRFYRDCHPGSSDFDPTITLGVYDTTNTLDQTITIANTLPTNLLSIGDSCYKPEDLCVEEAVYRKVITLPDNPKGYYISWQRCCRNDGIINILDPMNHAADSSGIVLYAQIPDPAKHNSTPSFGSYPNAYLCTLSENMRNFSCTDIDNDSLVYSLVVPLNGFSTPANPENVVSSGPYQTVNWAPSYSISNVVGGSPPMSIDEQTGIITASPDLTGLFVVAVKVEEYDRVTKIKLGEIRRDVQFYSSPCLDNQKPAFTSPLENEYKIFAGDSLCFIVKLDDQNSGDLVFISDAHATNNSSQTPILIFNPSADTGSVQSKFCIQTFCDDIREEPYTVMLNGNDSSCYGKSFVSKTIDFYVYSIDGTLKEPIPNIFTPNGDNQNDFFKINATTNDCYDSFKIKIYNRWGDKVFESTDFAFSWNGQHYRSNKKLPQGIYYYSFEGIFREQTIKNTGSVSLIW